jgi:hypothetical protein
MGRDWNEPPEDEYLENDVPPHRKRSQRKPFGVEVERPDYFNGGTFKQTHWYAKEKARDQALKAIESDINFPGTCRKVER